ncbi:hypothetical protein [Rhizobium sp. PAMB 3182]
MIETRAVSDADVATLAEAIDRVYFGTPYKTTYRQFVPKSWNAERRASRKVGPPDLEISAASLHDWLFGTGAVRFSSDPFDTATPQTIEAKLLDLPLDQPGVYYASPAGLVVLTVPLSKSLNDAIPLLRRYLVDTDTLIGAVTRVDPDWLVLVGRERTASLDQMAPLRTDTILTLASSHVVDLAQSYQRTAPLAGAVTDPTLVAVMHDAEIIGALFDIFGNDAPAQKRQGSVPLFFAETVLRGAVDWAPILLSRELTHTEYGQLLNMTDQMLKGWSQGNHLAYVRFPYPRPLGNPDARGIRSRLDAELAEDFESLTYNWNTAGFGSWTTFGDLQVFALSRTGSLPVSYFPDDGKFALDDAVETTIKRAEDEYWDFFAGMRDPYLARAAQYAALHVVFSAVQVKATRVEPMVSEKAYLERWSGFIGVVADTLADMSRQLKAGTHPFQAFKLSATDQIQLIIDAARGCLATTADYASWEDNTGSADANVLLRAPGDPRELATLLVDPDAAIRKFDAAWQRELHELRDKEDRLNEAIKKYNVAVTRCGSVAACSRSTLQKESNAIDEWGEKIDRDFEDLVSRREEFKDKIHRLSLMAGDLGDLARPFGDCSAAWKSIVDHVPPLPEAVYRTPGIVVSDNEVEALSVGGHNLDGRSVRILADDAIPAGKVQIDGKNGIIRLNPSEMNQAQVVVRTFERDYKRYAEGDALFQAKVVRRVEAALAQDTRAIQAFDAMVLKRGEAAAGGQRGYAIAALPTAARRAARIEAVRLDDALALELAGSVEAAGAEGAYRVLPDGLIEVSFPGGRPPIAVRVASREDIASATQRILEHVATDGSGAGRTMRFVDLSGSLSLSDMAAIKYSGAGRATASGGLPPKGPTGRGGLLFFGGEPPRRWSLKSGETFDRLLVCFLGRRGDPLAKLMRVDADWAKATVGQIRIKASGNGGNLSTLIEIPFRSVGSGPKSTFARLTAIFSRRAPTEADAVVLRETIEAMQAEEAALPFGMQLELIRRRFRESVNADASDKMLFHLKDTADDFHVVEDQRLLRGGSSHG